ncbi:helix-turn-helix domain-containing protein [Streptomyces sp. TRM43335]|uniref:Helix-turn-helix domain-containing protein n=1 Tax=Streptomyces taklimakanensis TaxID=2569853 RepID=A0A6G2B920_9ACTN|nr:helix-turn-helix transcriptional regulator [Streptomyces taklimakanensis]MTE18748.1 helix-turn-helix domain-containing protein [Streptomyces taklimakanensis]
MAAAEERAEFAELLRLLKERSGLSYGVLAKRLHMSSSTLHRYCNGDALPTDYAPVERLARICGATPEELSDLHRRWLSADTVRLRERRAAAEGRSSTAATIRPDPAGTGGEAAGPADGGHTGPADAAPVPDAAPAPVPVGGVPTVGRRRTAWLSAVAAAAVLASAVLALNTAGGDFERETPPAATPTEAAARRTPHLRAAPSSPSASPSASPSSARPTTRRPSTASAEGNAPSAPRDTRREEPTPRAHAEPLTVGVRPYAWRHPCQERYLVDRPPGQVPPPPTEQDAPGWASALGAVPAGDHLVELTVQGTGEETVVLKDLHVRVVERGAPPAWNAYVMGVGCGGNVSTGSFDVDLDADRPRARPVSGRRDFPYKVSESEPLVLYVTGRTAAHDVSWQLELEWSSGDRHGTLLVDAGGRPLRTAALEGRPLYGHPLGGHEWVLQPD